MMSAKNNFNAGFFYASIRTVQFHAVLSILFFCYYVNANDDDEGNKDYDDFAKSDESLRVESVEDFSEVIVIAGFLFLFGCCISLIATSVSYFIYTEEKILSYFLSSGVQIEAKVVDFRMVRKLSANCSEYCARVDYRYKCDDCDEESGYRFETVIRKHIRCLESDFLCVRKDDIAKNCENEGTTENCTSVCIEIQQSAKENGDRQFEVFPSFDMAVFDPPQHYHIVVVVLPGHPESAIGYQHVLRSTMQLQTQLPIVLLIVFLSLLSFFCVYLGLVKVLPIWQRGMTTKVSLLVVTVLFVIELLLIHFRYREAIHEMVYQDYIRRDNENIDVKTEDESLVTVSSGIATTSWKTATPLISSMPKHASHNKLESMDALEI
jgi:amino acid transporter